MTRGQPTARWRSVIGALGVLLLTPSAAGADTLRPTRFDDPPPNRCKPNDCSLREAIRAANSAIGPDKVVLSPGVYKLEIPGGATIDAGDLDLVGPLVLKGASAKETKVNAGGIDRVFRVDDGVVTLKKLTVRRGVAGANPNHADSGGGLAVYGGEVALKQVIMRANQAYFGGAIWSQAPELAINSSTIDQNRAAEGAGIDLRSNQTETPQTTIRASTLSRNWADIKGGGMLADGLGGGGGSFTPLALLENATVAGNLSAGGAVATAQGGGIMADNAATVILDNSTIAHNRAGDVVQNGIAGGVYLHSGATFSLSDSVVGENSIGSGGSVSGTANGAECAGAFQSSGGHVVQDAGNTCSVNGPVPSTAEPNLGPLQLNGGPTETVQLNTGSAALGFAETCPPFDQRRVPRPATDCDSGSFEAPG